ncbi:hypothetical protein PPSIR1_08551 [Plesiocystis pacifica SIR-1]|uniref:Uncharacterized protein n=1 Tax=Plesiocystis pacifica SIR-1 TaxID=391625 RepID=A6G787_9BACT|nr:hypothetical protein [Plesiocystis pacifica]EDM78221.1 hypothetical protein PPSIR1_08551 [Plesiocystis pacifica SIR-1]
MRPVHPLAPLDSAASAEALSMMATIWRERLTELSVRLAGARDAWKVEWVIHEWACERLASAAIRVGTNNEGLTGHPPARWRILVHVEASTNPAEIPLCALAVLDGRDPLLPDNVVAALVRAPTLPTAAIAARGGGRPTEDEAIIAAESTLVHEALVGHTGEGELPLALRLALARIVLEHKL